MAASLSLKAANPPAIPRAVQKRTWVSTHISENWITSV